MASANFSVTIVCQETGSASITKVTGLAISGNTLIHLAAAPSQIEHLPLLRAEVVRRLSSAGIETVTSAAESIPDDTSKAVLVWLADPARLVPIPEDLVEDVREARVLPVLPDKNAGVAKVIGNQYHNLNVETWSEGIVEVVPAILSLSEITAERQKAFISYRRADTSVVAGQLFDALSHETFDVFMDTFSIRPGVDFQKRLREHLGDKGLVLLLESQNLQASEWVQYEVSTALQCRLGILALNFPNAPKTANVEDEDRIHLTPNFFLPDGQLSRESLNMVVSAVKAAFDKALIRRKSLLFNAIRASLLIYGAREVSVDAFGFIRAKPKDKESKLEYVLVATPSPRN